MGGGKSEGSRALRRGAEDPTMTTTCSLKSPFTSRTSSSSSSMRSLRSPRSTIATVSLPERSCTSACSPLACRAPASHWWPCSSAACSSALNVACARGKGAGCQHGVARCSLCGAGRALAPAPAAAPPPPPGAARSPDRSSPWPVCRALLASPASPRPAAPPCRPPATSFRRNSRRARRRTGSIRPSDPPPDSRTKAGPGPPARAAPRPPASPGAPLPAAAPGR